MREAHILSAHNESEIQRLPLDDFSRFKEKVIMIDTFKSLLIDTDKANLKAIIEINGAKMTPKSLKQALEMIVDQAIKRAGT